MKTGTITSKQLAGKCPNGHRLCLSPRCWLATPKPRCDFASQANAQMGPCSSADHGFGTASHFVRDYFTQAGAIKRAKSTPVRADRNLYLCPAHAKRWTDLYPAGRAVLELHHGR